MVNTAAEKILRRLKGLQKQMRAGEEPLYTIPAIWDNATAKQSHACDLVLTNQRLFGYIYTTFPREHLFLEDIELASIKIVSLRKKNFEALFRELFVSDGEKKIYIRAPRQKIEQAYAGLRAAIAEHAPTTPPALTTDEPEKLPAAPIFGKQEVRQSLERSPQGITILFVCGLLLEIVGAIIWISSGSEQIGLPLCLAGGVAVLAALLSRRQLR